MKQTPTPMRTTIPGTVKLPESPGRAGSFQFHYDENFELGKSGIEKGFLIVHWRLKIQ
jgi:hypothetical protein